MTRWREIRKALRLVGYGDERLDSVERSLVDRMIETPREWRFIAGVLLYLRYKRDRLRGKEE